jgi:type I restriction enzyme, S subunit
VTSKSKQEYKQEIILPKYTTIQIPSEWDFVSLKDLIVNQNSGFHNRLERSEKGENIVGMVDLYKHTKINGQQFLLAKFPFKKKEQYKLHNGDLVYVEISLVRTGVGKTIYVTKKGENTYFAGNVRRFNVNEKCNPVFLYYLLNSEIFRNSIINRSYTTALTGITVKDYFKTRIPLPPIKIQEKIADILSNVDNLIENYDSIIEMTKKLKKSIMRQLLTKGIGHKKFKKIKWYGSREIEIPEEWDYEQIGSLTSHVTYGLTVRPKYVKEGVPLISAREINSGDLDFETASKISHEDFDSLYEKSKGMKDDILFSKTGTIGLVGRAKTNEIFAITQNVASLRPIQDRILPNFLELSVKTTLFYEKCFRTLNATTILDLQLGELKKMRLPLPSIEEQQKITSILSEIDSKRLDLESKKKSIRSLKKGLMQKFLTGQIRVVI